MKKQNLYPIAPLLCSCFFAVLIFISCEDKDSNPSLATKEEQMLNSWIWEEMNRYYLWNEQIPSDKSPHKATDPEKYFYSILFSEDRWSWITDDADALKNDFQGSSVTMGYSPTPFLINSYDVAIAINYVSPHSPAQQAGLKRGDVILAINGIKLNRENFYELYSQNHYASLSFAKVIKEPGISIDEGFTRDVNMTAIELEIDPVHQYKIIDTLGHKIGYLIYNQYTFGKNNQWKQSLDNALATFKTEGIQHLVIDLRFNPGGSIESAQHLASAIAPAGVSPNDLLVSFKYNREVENYFKSLIETGSEQDKKFASEQLYTYFSPVESRVDLNMDRLYFLTSSSTASASELTICALEPYMNAGAITIIGDTTSGKYTASITIEDSKNPKRHTWAMQPIIARYANKIGLTNFRDGFAPQYFLNPLVSTLKAYPLGKTSEPLLAKAVQLITGGAPRVKSNKNQPHTTPLPFISLPNPDHSKKHGLVLNGK